MIFTTWISDSNIQWDDLTLTTKSESYAFGRRLYTFQVAQQQYWLKFHLANTHDVLEQAFQRELDFYQQHAQIEQTFLLAHQIIQLRNITNGLDFPECGVGLLSSDTNQFFDTIVNVANTEAIQLKILIALDALDNMHQLGWIHGDLKVEHFRLYENSCKLIDFEQSCKLEHSIQNLTATPRYMAPELFHGKPKTVQTDLYAFGIILYEWLSQTRVCAKNYHDWAVLHCQKLQIQLPNELQCFLPLLNGLLHKHKEQRLTSVVEAKHCLNVIDLL